MSENARIYGPEAWRVATVYSALSVMFTLLLAIYPGFRRFPLPSGNMFPIAALALIVPLLTLVWGGMGFFRGSGGSQGRLCAVCMGVGGLCLAAVCYICWNDFLRVG